MEYWNTSQEVNYLNTIGEHHDDTFQNFSKLELLEGYLESIRKRTAWGDVDLSEVTSHVHKLIKAEKAKRWH